MEHVSTLCAAGTIGIAVTGFALGRPSPTKQRPLTARRRQSLLAKGYNVPSSSVIEPRPSIAAHPGIMSPSQLQHQLPSQDQTVRPSLDKGPQTQSNTLTRRPDDRAGLRPRRRTYVGPGIKINEEEVADELVSPTTSGRPSSSWLRRLSTITSSLNGSSVSGSRPQSPSINSSTTPFFPSSHLATSPNKLVKRSTSSHGLPQSYPSQTVGPAPLSILRRPATSHQRSATMRHRSSTDSRVGSTPPKLSLNSPVQDEKMVFTISHNGSWRPYFSRSSPTNRSEGDAKRRKPRNRSPRRLVARSSVPPTLLLASSIPTPGRNPNLVSDLDQSTICGGHHAWNSADLGNTPFTNRLATENEHLNTCCSVQEIDNEEFSSAWTMPRNVPHRSSFPQDNDYLKFSSMVVSGRSKSERLSGSSMRLRRRGNIRDPDLFRRPSTSSQVELTASHFHQIGAASENFIPKSRLRHLPNFTDLRYEALNLAASDSDIGNRNKSPAKDLSSPSSPTAHVATPPIGCSANQRHSAAVSDPASTLVGSDNDIKVFSSGEEDDTDFQSDIAFDSFPTRAASSSKSSRRGPRIETIFDHPNPTTAPKLVSLTTESCPSKADFTTHPSVPLKQAFEYVPNQRLPHIETYSPTPEAKLSDTPLDHDTSSPPSSNGPRIQRLSQTTSIQITDKTKVSLNGFCSVDHQRKPDITSFSGSPRYTSSVLKTSSHREDSSMTLNEDSEKNSRLCLYDWSEQQTAKKDEQGAGIRPRTSHAAHLLDLRGGRTVIRRTSSSLHLRSQSVPISRDPAAQKEPSNAKKFGTWGLGNKGASEDWDCDFDFGDSDRQGQINPAENHHDKVNVNQTMKVPQAIMERQESVYGQFGHVQELTVLVEELKLLRARARAMQIVEGPSSELWKEAQGIISLATFEEDDEHELRLRRSTSSLTFSSEEFETDLGPDKQPPRLADTLTVTDDQFAFCEMTSPLRNENKHRRPRTDSSTKAKYVLDTIHRERKSRESGYIKASTDGQHILAFDTQSLRDLVIRASVVTRALKDVVRKADGVCLSPETDSNNLDPPFSKIFNQPQGDSAALTIHS
ncbi:hypothetical protein PRK78_000999 [Emydomyces testavorans]|uniref:Uncharacterized protein n=1 Tax=Emydomyces testavorans TaxID=2070801 RepID=A0AAF0DC49_9EURO|nr:hypothetical protein PRK78_000999 [Emydomyces testavorans]